MRYMNSNVATTQTKNAKVCNTCFACQDVCAPFLTSRKLCASKLLRVTLSALAISKPIRWTTRQIGKGAVSSNHSYGTLITGSHSIITFLSQNIQIQILKTDLHTFP